MPYRSATKPAAKGAMPPPKISPVPETMPMAEAISTAGTASVATGPVNSASRPRQCRDEQQRKEQPWMHQDLSSVVHASTTIGEIAYRWGFADLGDFNRAFRQRFAMTPSEVRKLALQSLRP